jgi:hypothetical protein
VQLHREALESEHVSAHLHEWVDLIFGHKQRGEAAEIANNVFYHLTSEGATRASAGARDDPVALEAIAAQISNFGQTPAQLFLQPHPARVAPPPGRPLAECSALCLTMEPAAPVAAPMKGLWAAAGGMVTAVDPAGLIRTMAGAVRVPEFAGACAAGLAEDGRALALAAADGMASIWRVGAGEGEAATAAARCCFERAATAVAVSSAHDLLAFGGADGHVWTASLATGLCIRGWQLEGAAAGAPVISVAITPHTGRVAAATADRLALYSKNGRLLASVAPSAPVAVVCVLPLPLSEMLLCAEGDALVARHAALRWLDEAARSEPGALAAPVAAIAAVDGGDAGEAANPKAWFAIGLADGTGHHASICKSILDSEDA